MTKVNYQSDFDFILTLKDCRGNDIGFPEYDWVAKFYTINKEKPYIASYIDGECTNCYNDNGKIHIVLNEHGLMSGQLKVDFSINLPNGIYPDDGELIVAPLPLDIELIRGCSPCPCSSDIEVVIPYAVVDAYDMATANGFTGSREDFVDGLNALPDLAAMASEVTAGKAAVADALTRQGFETAPDTPLSDMARTIGSMPVTQGNGEDEDSLLANLPNLVKRNFRADYPYVAAFSTSELECTLAGADAYLPRGGEFMTAADAPESFSFPDDGRENWLLCFFNSPNYTVPYSNLATYRSVYCRGGIPAFGVENGKGKILEVISDGLEISPGSNTLTGGTWTTVATTLTENSSTILSSCTALNELSLPTLTENSGTIASSCAALSKINLPKLTKIKSGTFLLQSCNAVTGIYLPSLKEIETQTRFIQNNSNFKTFYAPKLEKFTVRYNYYPFNTCNGLQEISLPSLRELIQDSLSSPVFYVCAALKKISFDSLETWAQHIDRNCLISGALNSSLLEIYLPSLKFTKDSGFNNLYCAILSTSSLGNTKVHIHLGAPQEGYIFLNAQSNTDLTSAELLTILPGFRSYLNLSKMPNLTKDCLEAIIANLADNTDYPTLDLVLGATNLAKLSDETKAIATQKNWTLS